MTVQRVYKAGDEIRVLLDVEPLETAAAGSPIAHVVLLLVLSGGVSAAAARPRAIALTSVPARTVVHPAGTIDRPGDVVHPAGTQQLPSAIQAAGNVPPGIVGGLYAAAYAIVSSADRQVSTVIAIADSLDFGVNVDDDAAGVVSGASLVLHGLRIVGSS